MVGRRTLSYYRKLTDIPRVAIGRPDIKSSEFIDRAHLVVTLGGSMGFEAAVARKPVVTLGNCLYNALPETVVRHVRSLIDLPGEIARAIASYEPDDEALLDYVAGIYHYGVSVNLYSNLLGRLDTYKPNDSSASDDFRRLAQHVISRKAQLSAPGMSAESAKAASW
jgi:hypothetical protein